MDALMPNTIVLAILTVVLLCQVRAIVCGEGSD